MKLSIKRRFGFVQVRGGRVVTVTHDHQIPIGTESSIEDKRYARKWSGEKWVTAKIGDLAIEIFAVKTDKLLGYSYLSGNAIRLNLYRNDVEHWFEAAKVYRVKTEPLEQQEMTPEQFVAGMMRCKYADARVVVFHMFVKTKDDLMTACEVFKHSYGYAPFDVSDEQEYSAPTNLLAHIESRKPEHHALMHFQPPKDSQEYAATGFQIELVHGSPACEPFDPWNEENAPQSAVAP